MAKLHFRYSAMNAGKSMNLITTHYNYKELGLKPLAVISDISKKKKIWTRAGLTVDAIKFSKFKSEYIEKVRTGEYDVVLVDEVQFLSTEDIILLRQLSAIDNIPVICYGLRTSYNIKQPFEGSAMLLGLADELVEIPTLCWCGKKARMNLITVNDEVKTNGDIVQLRGEGKTKFHSVCPKHFFEKKIK